MDALKSTYAGGATQKRGGPFFKPSHQHVVTTNSQSVIWNGALRKKHYSVMKCAVWLAFIDSEHAVTAIAACVEKKTKQSMLCEQVRIGYHCVERQPRSPAPTTHPFQCRCQAASVCGWVGAVQTDLCRLKTGNKTPARLPIRKESSQKGPGRKRLSGRGREKGGGRSLFSGFDCAPKLRKPWPGCSLALLFSISLFFILFHNTAMEDLQPLHRIWRPRQRVRNSARLQSA